MTAVAIVPAKDRADSIGATVTALSRLDALDAVVVVDDGSTDATSEVAAAAGASVVRLARNQGKGAAVTAGVASAPGADVYLLIDADLGDTAGLAESLLAPVAAGEADMTVAVLPGAGTKAGFGAVRRLAAGGIRRATGFTPRAPLSGQRAVRGELLRSLRLADRFGIEAGLTIDALRAGARVVEVDVAMDHRHTGRRLDGFRHRGAQGLDIARALWPRLTSASARRGLVLAAFVVATTAALVSGSAAEPPSRPALVGASKVVIVGLPGLSWNDVGLGRLPTLDRLIEEGASSATNVRTVSGRPSAAEAYATLGAGARVEGEDKDATLAVQASALGDALHGAGRKLAVVGEFGRAAGGDLVALDRDIAEADVVVVDVGDLEGGLRSTDEALAEVVARVPEDGLLLVVSVVPPGREWRLTPTVVHGKDVPHGYLHSPSTRRAGLVTLTDVAPTVLAALGVAKPDGMIGHPFRYRPGVVDLGRFRTLDRDSAYREGIYLPLTVAYIVAQVLLYLLAILTLRRAERSVSDAERGHERGHRLRVPVLAVAAYPLATMVFRAVPNVADLGVLGVVVLVAIDFAIVALASRARRHRLSPLAWILAFTVAVLAVDVATGARLQASSLLGYSLHTASRFTGFGNVAFATLAAATVLLGAIHVAFAPRRREAVLAVGCLFAFVVIIDGAPSLGSDVGGILTLVPVLGLTLVVLGGRRVGIRAMVTAALVTLAVLLLATGIDLLRPAETRTHLGRLVAAAGENGFGVFIETASRRLAVTFRSFRSPGSPSVVLLTGYMLHVLVRAKGWRELLPEGSPLRAGVVGALAAGLIGYVVNDSGVVVLAMVFVFVGPVLTLLALEHAREAALDGVGGTP